MPNFEGKIEAENPTEHAEILYQKLVAIQLYFAEEKFKKEQVADQKIKFSDVLDKYTSLTGGLRGLFMKVNDLNKTEETLDYLDPLMQKIDAIYDGQQANWQQEIINLLNGEEKKLIEQDKAKQQTEGQPKAITKIGPLIYNTQNLRYNSPDRQKILAKNGLDEFDDYLEIHVEQIFANKETGLRAQQLKEWLGKLAEIIVDKYPRTRALIGTSWLMDTPLAKKLGFLVTDLPIDQNLMSTWLQFIDKNGQIHKDRIKKLVDSGEFPYQAKFGLMTVEDFLKKYLPQDKRGQEIELEEINPALKDFTRQVHEASLGFKNRWMEITEDKIEETLNQYPAMISVLEQADIKSQWLAILKNMKAKNLTWGQGRTEFKDEFEAMSVKMEATVKAKLYLKKKIIIE